MSTTSELLKALGIGGATLGAGAALHGAGLGKILEPLDYPRQALWNLAASPYRALEEGSLSPLLGAIPGAAGAVLGGVIGGPAGVLAGSALGGTLQGIGHAAGRREFDAPSVSDLTGTEDFLPNLAVGLATDPLTYAGLSQSWRHGARAIKGRAAATPIDALAAAAPREAEVPLARVADIHPADRPFVDLAAHEAAHPTAEDVPLPGAAPARQTTQEAIEARRNEIATRRQELLNPVPDDVRPFVETQEQRGQVPADVLEGPFPENRNPYIYPDDIAAPRQNAGLKAKYQAMLEKPFTEEEARAAIRDIDPDSFMVSTLHGDLAKKVVEKAYDTLGMAHPGVPKPIKGFYSRLEKGLNALPESIEANKVLKTIKTQDVSKGKEGVSNAEIEWLGLDKYLAGKKGKVTKQELLNHFDENKIVVEEMPANYGDQGDTTKGGKDYFEWIVKRPNPPRESPRFALNEVDNPHGPGGKSWQILGEDDKPMFNDAMFPTEKQAKDYASKYHETTSAPYQEPHYAPHKNIIGFFTGHDRVGPNGEKILHIDQVQAQHRQTATSLYTNEIEKAGRPFERDIDRLANEINANQDNPEMVAQLSKEMDAAEAGKKEAIAKAKKEVPEDYGYATDKNVTEVLDKKVMIDDELTALRGDLDYASKSGNNPTDVVETILKDRPVSPLFIGSMVRIAGREGVQSEMFLEHLNAIRNNGVPPNEISQIVDYLSKPEVKGYFDHVESIRDALDKALTEKSQIHQRLRTITPDTPFKEESTALLLRVAIRKAAEKGYDRITISPGEHVASYTGGAETGQKAYYGSYAEPPVAGTIPNWLNKFAKKFGVKVEPYDISNHGIAKSAQKEYERLLQLKADLLETKPPGWEEKLQILRMVIDTAKMKIDHFDTPSVMASSMPLTPEMRQSILSKGQPLLNIAAPLGGSALLAALMNQQES